MQHAEVSQTKNSAKHVQLHIPVLIPLSAYVNYVTSRYPGELNKHTFIVIAHDSGFTLTR